jgi:hypothetical protein
MRAVTSSGLCEEYWVPTHFRSACLGIDAFVWVQIQRRVARDRYHSRLDGMVILAMTSTRALQSLAIRLDELDSVPNLHASRTCDISCSL